MLSPNFPVAIRRKTNPKRALVSLTAFFIAGASFSVVHADTSPLWGEHGENWSPQGRLSDWSFAGYHSGEAPIPTPPVKGNVRDFGALGDGKTDDTAAFQRAIAATNDGALLIPTGRYLLSDILTIRKSNFVLRGEGPNKSVLSFSKPLEAIKPLAQATTGGRPTSGYSWSGGLVWVQGKIQGDDLGLVKTPSARGDHRIELMAPAKVQVGQRIEIRQQDGGDKSLLDTLYSGQTGDTANIKSERVRTSFVSRVVGVAGNTITLQRPLRTDIDPKWNASARIFAPTVSEVGIENLGFEFPNLPYEGHFTEQGFNPLAFSGVSDCWARDLRIFNADSGPFVGGNFITVQNIVFDANRAPDKGGYRGHHGVTLGSDTLLRDFDYRIKFIHDISVDHGASGNVASNGRGVDLSFDNHRDTPHANLFTNIDIGAGTDMYRSGGGNALGKHSGALSTWWNIRSTRPQKYPPADFGPDSLNFVGIASDEKPIADKDGRWFKPLSPDGLQPADLYEAQLARRLAGDKTK